MEPPDKRPTKEFHEVAGKITYLEFCLKQDQREQYKNQLQEKEQAHAALTAKLQSQKEAWIKEEYAKPHPAPPGRPLTAEQRRLEAERKVTARINQTLHSNKQEIQQWQKTYLEKATGQRAPERGKPPTAQQDRAQTLTERFRQSADRRQQEHGRRREDRER